MEQELIIAEILRNKPQGIKLYSPIFGNCTFCYIKDESSDICVRRPYNEVSYFNFDGVYHAGGECLLFPSNEMRDWSKFAWKKGDILVNRDKNIHLIFEKFIDDTYTIFAGKHCYEKDYRNEYNYERKFDGFKTEYFTLETGDAAQKYLKTIEEKLDGKLNRETLEIEKPQPEFKDGDIVVAEEDNYYDKVIFIAAIKDAIVSKALINVRYEDYEVHYNEYRFGHNRSLRLATASEKQQLFDALEKEGKAWDAEKKQIVDLKPKYEFKPMDLCLMKYIGQYNNRGWELCQYAYTEHRVSSSGEQRDFYHAVGGEIYAECIPYKGNEHLLGTKKSK